MLRLFVQTKLIQFNIEFHLKWKPNKYSVKSLNFRFRIRFGYSKQNVNFSIWFFIFKKTQKKNRFCFFYERQASANTVPLQLKTTTRLPVKIFFQNSCTAQHNQIICTKYTAETQIHTCTHKRLYIQYSSREYPYNDGFLVSFPSFHFVRSWQWVSRIFFFLFCYFIPMV